MITKGDWFMITQGEKTGKYLKDIAEEQGIHPRTVRRALDRGRAGKVGRPSGTSKLDPYKGWIDRRLGEGVWNAVVLYREVKERDDSRPLDGLVPIDDAYWGGERRGGKRGRGAPGKTPFVAAVECTPDGRPMRLRLTRVSGFRKPAIACWARKHLTASAVVVSDGLAAFRGVVEAGCIHEPHVTGGGPESCQNPNFRWVNTILGNVKNAIHGTYHAVREKHLPRYLAEFCYRFNRRFQLEDLLPRFVSVATRTSPLPYRIAKLAEDHG